MLSGMEADDFLRSRNAWPRKALVGRAQWKIISPHPYMSARTGLERGSGEVQS